MKLKKAKMKKRLQYNHKLFKALRDAKRKREKRLAAIEAEINEKAQTT